MLEPSYGLTALMNNVIVQDERDGFGLALMTLKLLQHGNKQL